MSENERSPQSPASRVLLGVSGHDHAPFLIKSSQDSAAGPPNITRLPPSDVLARVKMFLPEMERANQTMQEQLNEDPSALNMEQVDEDEEHISMNLGLGEMPESGESGDEDATISSDESPAQKGATESSPSKPLKKPKIEVLS